MKKVLVLLLVICSSQTTPKKKPTPPTVRDFYLNGKAQMLFDVTMVRVARTKWIYELAMRPSGVPADSVQYYKGYNDALWAINDSLNTLLAKLQKDLNTEDAKKHRKKPAARR